MILYEAYNTKNGRAYIGLTTKSLEHRKSQHIRSAKSNSNTVFSKAIRKHGPDSFEWNVIAKCSTFEDLCRLERLFISLHEPWQLYNTSLGGEAPAYGMKHTEKTKELCGAYAKERWEGKRAKDLYPEWVFEVPTYKEARKYGVPKTTWYRHRVVDLT
jgi:group I intron endonuclease